MSDDKYVILGQPPSKSNGYKVITLRTKTGGYRGSLGKTKVLTDYEQSFFIQCPLRGQMISGRFGLDLNVFFRSDLPDLDNALKIVLDCLQQCKAIKNDRYCVDIHIRKFVDKNNPRIEFSITPLI